MWPLMSLSIAHPPLLIATCHSRHFPLFPRRNKARELGPRGAGIKFKPIEQRGQLGQPAIQPRPSVIPSSAPSYACSHSSMCKAIHYGRHRESVTCADGVIMKSRLPPPEHISDDTSYHRNAAHNCAPSRTNRHHHAPSCIIRLQIFCLFSCNIGRIPLITQTSISRALFCCHL
jgi:hypothetical protein